MTPHFELARGSRRTTAKPGAHYIDGREKLGKTQPITLLGVDGYTKLSESQFIRLSRELGSELLPDLKGKQVQVLKDLCLVAKCSEEFFLSASKDHWLRTAIICNKQDPNDLFSSEVAKIKFLDPSSPNPSPSEAVWITIHSNVVPRDPYWSKLKAVREEVREVARKRVYFPSTFLDVAISEDKSLVEKLNEWEDWEQECPIAEQCHDRDDDQERDKHRASRPFWKIGADDVKLVDSTFVEGSSQADVWKILWRGGIFARKVFKDKSAFDRELEVVRKVSGHPHIVYSFGVSINTDEKQRDHSLLMELLDNDLHWLIADRVRLRGCGHRPPFSRPDSVHILLQVAKAMAYVHNLAEPVIHGDLKPHNILVSHCEILGGVCQYFVKVADFGSARILESKSSSTFNPTRGTTKWAAPEVLKAFNRSSEKISIDDDPKKIDVYGFGIVAFQVLTGLEPYEGSASLLVQKEGSRELVPYEGVSTRGDLRQGVVGGTLRPPLREACSRPNFWSDRQDLIALVESCWNSEPSARPHFSEVADRLESIYNDLNQVRCPAASPCPGT